MSDPELLARVGLCCVVEPATPGVVAAVAEFGAAAVWERLQQGRSGPVSERARQITPESVLAEAEALGVRFVVPGAPEWPAGLQELATCEEVNQMTGMPFGIWCRGSGDLAGLAATSVSMVGARACTSYGEAVAAELAHALAQAGYAVISGGAFGIDAAAHRGALASRTPTVAVLPGGVDRSYPPSHDGLFRRICEAGVLVSELPPGAHPTRSRFLGRNRLIAALSPGTVLIEAAARSGARNTVTWANCLGRVVMAVPGPVTSAASFTPHRLIRHQEAVLVTSAEEIRELVGELGRPERRAERPVHATDALSAEELRVFESLPARGGLAAGEVALASGVMLGNCLAALESLAETGFVVQDKAWRWRIAAGFRNVGRSARVSGA